MKKIASLFLCLVFLVSCKSNSPSNNPITNPNTATYDATGNWVVQLIPLTYNPGTCGFTDNPYNLTPVETTTITQTGTTVSLLVISDSTLYSGTVSNAEYSLSTSVSSPPTTNDMTITFTLSNALSGAGTHTWSISGGGVSCDGTNSVSATKI